MKKYDYDVFGISDVGIEKKINQDSYIYYVTKIDGEKAGIFAVADGVGGLSNGEVASKIAIEELVKWWESITKMSNINISDIKLMLEKLFKLINEKIIEQGKKNGSKMGSTFSVLFTYMNKGVICHIGDSRIYKYTHRLVSNELIQLTTDHSKDMSYQTEQGVFVKSLLTQCLGIHERIFCNIEEITLSKNEHYLVCSDGIYKKQENRLIKKIVKEQYKPIDVCSELINSAKRLGEKDNITVIEMKVKETS